MKLRRGWVSEWLTGVVGDVKHVLGWVRFGDTVRYEDCDAWGDRAHREVSGAGVG